MTDRTPIPMRGRATFDRTRRYRYTLHREWAKRSGTPTRTVCFCLLNPSTADARVLDPTLTRCLRFAQDWGFDAMEVVNAFALRSTDPKGLRVCDDPVGPSNDAAIRRALSRADRFVVGWGTHATLGGRDEMLRAMIARSGREVLAFGHTREGHPKHPLYLAASTTPVRFEP